MSGIDFVALQVRDPESAATFLETHLGWTRTPEGPPHAIVFATEPIPVAVREPYEDLPVDPRLGVGAALWVKVDDTRALAGHLSESGVELLDEVTQGPFGWTTTIVGPERYQLTLHDG
ncbi:VOC family protein [soil metagenome]|jgi:predicted enzyme related to lactoylglutathione lyase